MSRTVSKEMVVIAYHVGRVESKVWRTRCSCPGWQGVLLVVHQCGRVKLSHASGCGIIAHLGETLREMAFPCDSLPEITLLYYLYPRGE